MADVWGAIPLCFMWIIWRECNNHMFEGGCSHADMKIFFFLRTLYDWIAALSCHSFSNIL